MATESSVEREIRIASEREEDFRKLKRLLSRESIDLTAEKPQKEMPKPAKVVENLPAIEDDVFENRKESTISTKNEEVAEEESRNEIDEEHSDHKGSDNKNGGSKDIQYEMATARLKKEIEETINREKELHKEGRLKSLNSVRSMV